jgi:glycosyltransferase involved in cell wall biosynthesis
VTGSASEPARCAPAAVPAAPPRAVLQVSTADRLGGAEGSAWNLFDAYRRSGIDSWLAVGTKLGDDPDVFAIPNDARRPAWVVALRQAQRRAQAAGLVRRAQALGAAAWLGEPRRFLSAKLLGREDYGYPGCAALLACTPRPPEILHCHNLHGNYFDLRVLPELGRRVPLILNLRDEWLLTGHCAYSMGCERWRDACGRCPDLSRYPALTRDTTAHNLRSKRRILSKTRAYVTAPSQWLLARARAAMPAAAGFKRIANSVHPAFFSADAKTTARLELGLPATDPVIGFSAHSAFKDFATVRAALEVLGQTHAAHAVCFGRGGPAERAGRIDLRFLGFVDDPREVARRLRCCDVFIHAATAEAFGKGAAEAAACGVPVVASSVGGLVEVVRDGENGLLVPPRDPRALAAAVASILAEPARAAALGSAGRRRAASEFSLDRQVAEFLAWYAEVRADWLEWVAQGGATAAGRAGARTRRRT